MRLRFWKRRDYTPYPETKDLWGLLQAHREGAFQMVIEELLRYDEEGDCFRPAIRGITRGGLRRVHKRVVRSPIQQMRRKVG